MLPFPKLQTYFFLFYVISFCDSVLMLWTFQRQLFTKVWSLQISLQFLCLFTLNTHIFIRLYLQFIWYYVISVYALLLSFIYSCISVISLDSCILLKTDYLLIVYVSTNLVIIPPPPQIKKNNNLFDNTIILDCWKGNDNNNKETTKTKQKQQQYDNERCLLYF